MLSDNAPKFDTNRHEYYWGRIGNGTPWGVKIPGIGNGTTSITLRDDLGTRSGLLDYQTGEVSEVIDDPENPETLTLGEKTIRVRRGKAKRRGNRKTRPIDPRIIDGTPIPDDRIRVRKQSTSLVERKGIPDRGVYIFANGIRFFSIPDWAVSHWTSLVRVFGWIPASIILGITRKRLYSKGIKDTNLHADAIQSVVSGLLVWGKPSEFGNPGYMLASVSNLVRQWLRGQARQTRKARMFGIESVKETDRKGFDWDAANTRYALERADYGFRFGYSKPQCSEVYNRTGTTVSDHFVRSTDFRMDWISEVYSQSTGTDSVVLRMLADGRTFREIREATELTHGGIIAIIRRMQRAAKATYNRVA